MTGTLAHAVFAMSLTLSIDTAADVPQHVRPLESADGSGPGRRHGAILRSSGGSSTGSNRSTASCSSAPASIRVGRAIGWEGFCLNTLPARVVSVFSTSSCRVHPAVSAVAILAHELQHAVEVLEAPCGSYRRRRGGAVRANRHPGACRCRRDGSCRARRGNRCPADCNGPSRHPLSAIHARASSRCLPSAAQGGVDPIEREMQLRDGRRKWPCSDHIEPLTIGTDVVVRLEDRQLHSRLEKDARFAGPERRDVFDVDGHQALAGEIEQLAPIRRPHRSAAALRRNLPFLAGSPERPDIDIGRSPIHWRRTQSIARLARTRHRLRRSASAGKARAAARRCGRGSRCRGRSRGRSLGTRDNARPVTTSPESRSPSLVASRSSSPLPSAGRQNEIQHAGGFRRVVSDSRPVRRPDRIRVRAVEREARHRAAGKVVTPDAVVRRF